MTHRRPLTILSVYYRLSVGQYRSGALNSVDQSGSLYEDEWPDVGMYSRSDNCNDADSNKTAIEGVARGDGGRVGELWDQ